MHLSGESGRDQMESPCCRPREAARVVPDRVCRDAMRSAARVAVDSRSEGGLWCKPVTEAWAPERSS